MSRNAKNGVNRKSYTTQPWSLVSCGTGLCVYFVRWEHSVLHRICGFYSLKHPCLNDIYTYKHLCRRKWFLKSGSKRLLTLRNVAPWRIVCSPPVCEISNIYTVSSIICRFPPARSYRRWDAEAAAPSNVCRSRARWSVDVCAKMTAKIVTFEETLLRSTAFIMMLICTSLFILNFLLVYLF